MMQLVSCAPRAVLAPQRTAMAAPVALRAAAAARRSPPARRRLVVAAAADELLGAADVDPDNARAAIAVGLKYSGAGQWAKAQVRVCDSRGVGSSRQRGQAAGRHALYPAPSPPAHSNFAF